MQIRERRSAKRIPLAFNGYAVIDGLKIPLKTHDVSQTGALVEIVDFGLPIQEAMQLGVHLDNGFVGNAVVYRVAAREEGAWYGVKFNRFDFHSDLLLTASIFHYEHNQRTLH